MKKVIAIGSEPYEVEYSSEVAFKVLDAVLDWMQKKSHGASHCGEGLHQDDNCLIDAPTLVSDIVDDILQPKYLGEPDEGIF